MYLLIYEYWTSTNNADFTEYQLWFDVHFVLHEIKKQSTQRKEHVIPVRLHDHMWFVCMFYVRAFRQRHYRMNGFKFWPILGFCGRCTLRVLKRSTLLTFIRSSPRTRDTRTCDRAFGSGTFTKYFNDLCRNRLSHSKGLHTRQTLYYMRRICSKFLWLFWKMQENAQKKRPPNLDYITIFYLQFSYW